jgi:thiol-disulfide isomerase/thioredoxin
MDAEGHSGGSLMKAVVRIAVMAAALALGAGVQAQQMTDMKMAHGFAPFTKAAFKAAADSGKTTLVFFHAPWCPVCKAQEPKVLAHLNGDAKDVVALKVDYDTNVDLRKEMNVEKQSTLILYSGSKEVARLSYKSDDASIDELFKHVPMGMMKKDMK